MFMSASLSSPAGVLSPPAAAASAAASSGEIPIKFLMTGRTTMIRKTNINKVIKPDLKLLITVSSWYQGIKGSSGATGSNLAGISVTLSPRASSKPTTPRTKRSMRSSSCSVYATLVGSPGVAACPSGKTTGRSLMTTATVMRVTPPCAFLMC